MGQKSIIDLKKTISQLFTNPANKYVLQSTTFNDTSVPHRHVLYMIECKGNGTAINFVKHLKWQLQIPSEHGLCFVFEALLHPQFICRPFAAE